jgi:arsenate reductase (glutaredoxin)
MLKVYTYKACSTCRKAIKHLQQAGVEAQEIPIREQPPTLAELKRMLATFDGDIKQLFNRSGQDYRALNLKDKLPGMSEKEALALLASNGNLVRRPFAFIGKNGVVGYDKEAWDDALIP